MKNLNYKESLTKVVPPEIRLEVYKESLYTIQNWEDGFVFCGLNIPYLCLILPVILYDLDDFREKEPFWIFYQTQTAFPELTDDIMDSIFASSNQNFTRIKFLQESIKKLENELTTTV